MFLIGSTLALFAWHSARCPLEDRARMERMIAQARQAVCEARQGKRRSLERRETVKAIVLRCLAEESRQKAGLRATEDDTPR